MLTCLVTNPIEYADLVLRDLEGEQGRLDFLDLAEALIEREVPTEYQEIVYTLVAARAVRGN